MAEPEAASVGSSPTSKDSRTWGQKASEYMVNDGPKLVLIIIWVLANFAVIIERFYHYMVQAPVLFNVLGHGLTIARSGAAVVKLNSMLILLSVLRNFLSWLRGTFVGTYLPIDKNIVFHRYIAWTIAGGAAFHIIAHMFNFLTVSNATPEQLKLFGLTQSVTPGQLAGTTVAGTTGYIITIVQILMYSSAIKYIRGPMFNVFWFTHHLFIVFFGLLCIHGVGSLLGEPASYWYWFIGPGVFYAIERTVRILRGNQDTILQLAVAHPSKVLELQLKKSTFKYKPGQYLFLNCPYIAKYEWHPFTISSAPEEEYVSVHIRIVGDWTSELWAFINPNKKLGVVQENLLTAPDGSSIFRIDGPFGTASEDVFEFQTVMLVAGGIGVTPFGSILKNIRYKLESQGQTVLEKVYFYWISRDKNAFEWFNEVLAALEQDNINNFLEINTYLTGQMSVDEIRTIMHGVDAEADSITGLQSRTHFGRPNWDEIFQEKSTVHQGKSVGVFFCGPQVLSKQLYKCCKKYTSAVTKTKFVYHKENF